MKVFVAGKGGVGKSVIAVGLAKVLADRGHRVLIIDADESNACLYKMLGVNAPRPIIEYLGGRKRAAEAMLKRSEIDVLNVLARAREKIIVDDIPSNYIAKTNGIELIVVGKVREFCEGCACPINFVTKVFLKYLDPRGRVVIVDSDAGVEHIGRGVEEAVDTILAIADPTYEALSIASILRDLANKLGKRFLLIINKVSKEIEDVVKSIARSLDLKITAIVPFDESVARSMLLGKPLEISASRQSLEIIADTLGLRK